MPLNKETKQNHLAQSAGVVKYTDCTYADEKTPTSVPDMTLNNLMVRSQ